MWQIGFQEPCEGYAGARASNTGKVSGHVSCTELRADFFRVKKNRKYNRTLCVEGGMACQKALQAAWLQIMPHLSLEEHVGLTEQSQLVDEKSGRTMDSGPKELNY